jgi:hypothetical protein
MHEHGSDDRRRLTGGIGAESTGDEGPLLDERVPGAQFEEEHQYIEGYQCVGDDWNCPARAIIVAERKHHWLSFDWFQSLIAEDVFIFMAGSMMTFFPFVLATAIGLSPPGLALVRDPQEVTRRYLVA